MINSHSQNALSIYNFTFTTTFSPHTITMAFLHSTSTATNSLIILLLIVLPHLACSQAPTTPSPTLTDCVSHLLPLSPCAPYVQGTVQSPAQMCCVNLKQVYSQHPSCLCLLLNGTALSSMPINTTLALQLPDACGLQVDVSTCSGKTVTFHCLKAYMTFF